METTASEASWSHACDSADSAGKEILGHACCFERILIHSIYLICYETEGWKFTKNRLILIVRR